MAGIIAEKPRLNLSPAKAHNFVCICAKLCFPRSLKDRQPIPGPQISSIKLFVYISLLILSWSITRTIPGTLLASPTCLFPGFRDV